MNIKIIFPAGLYFIWQQNATFLNERMVKSSKVAKISTFVILVF